MATVVTIHGQFLEKVKIIVPAHVILALLQELTVNSN